MSDVLGEICSEAERVMAAGEYSAMSQNISRTAISHAFGSKIETKQTKMLAQEDMERLKIEDPSTLATPAWFHNAEWLSHPGERPNLFNIFWIEARYPMPYFEEEPKVGSFIGNDWHDQYGSISGFGSHDKISLWTPEFVAPGERFVTRLRFPDDPTAMERYNARYRQYLQVLDEAETTVSYHRAWDQKKDDATVIGGMSLYGVGINRVLVQGSPEVEDEVNATALHFHLVPKTDGHVGRILTIIGEEATTEDYFDEDGEAVDEASDGILEAALQLIRVAGRSKLRS